jgi:Kdo2-lipid IVA lauroyltransferase/acyltransferase
MHFWIDCFKLLIMSFTTRYISHPLQALAALIFFTAFRLLPLGVASAIGGGVGRAIGPKLSVTRRARRNISRAFPEKTETEIGEIVSGLWDNLGRLAGEYPHLAKIDVYDPSGPVEVVGAEYVDQLRDDGKAGIFVSAHIGNWEIVPLCGSQRGLPIDRVYRAANNRLVEWLYRQGRAATEGALIPKGPQGARLLLKSLRDGQHLGVLMDQKMNDGIPVPFFGRDAMTAPAIAELALRFECPVVPVHIERLGGPKFRIILEPPLDIEVSGNRQADVQALMVQINSKIESWVRARPEQWLWLHNRWSD